MCQRNDIDHRCTKTFTPKTNGMVEKANDIIKNKTIKITAYANLEQMNQIWWNSWCITTYKEGTIALKVS